MEHHESTRKYITPESQEEHHLPAITFHIADDEQNAPFKEDLLKVKDELDPAWRTTEQKVLSTFEEVTGGTWSESIWRNGIRVTLTATEGSKTHPGKYLQLGCREVKSRWAKQQGLIGTMRNVHSLQGSLIHELGHNFMNSEDLKYMQDTFGSRFHQETTALNEKGFFNEVYAEVITEAVAAKNFPDHVSALWKERQRLGHRGVYEFLDTLSHEEKQMILDRRHHSRVISIEEEPSISKSRLAEIRARLGSVIRRT